MQRAVNRARAAVGIALIGCGLGTAAPVAATAAAGSAWAVRLTAGAEQITLDLVRHGQSTDDLNDILGTLPPGAPLSDAGVQQANTVAAAIQDEFPGGLAGIYASDLIRTQQTAAPLAAALGMDVGLLSGLNEVGAGIFEGQPRDLVTEIGYFTPMAAWVLGFPLVSEFGSINGVQFDDQVGGAVDAIYHDTVDAGGPLADVAYTSGGVIAIWTLMNVKNPPIALLVQQLLETLGPPPNAGQAILQGNPTDGWTMVSWDGTAVPQTPDLLTGLFVDVRDVISAPQVPAWHIWEALQAGDPDGIGTALQIGVTDVFNAIAAFPQAVIDTITGSMADSAGGDAGDALGDLLGALGI